MDFHEYPTERPGDWQSNETFPFAHQDLITGEKFFVSSPFELAKMVVQCKKHHYLPMTGVFQGWACQHCFSFPLWPERDREVNSTAGYGPTV